MAEKRKVLQTRTRKGIHESVLKGRPRFMDDFISVQFTHCYYHYSDKNRVSMDDSTVLSNGVGDSSCVLCSHQWSRRRRRYCDIAGSTKNCPMNIHGAFLGPLLSITRHSRVQTSTSLSDVLQLNEMKSSYADASCPESGKWNTERMFLL